MPERIHLKTAEQVTRMRAAGLVVADALAAVREAAAVGVALAELDAVAAAVIAEAGAQPSFLHYGVPPYPAVTCISVNEAVVHGIPDARVLEDGDLVSVDCGAIVDGWHGDAAITIPIGEVSAAAAALSEACELSLWHGIAAMVDGGRLNDIGAAVEDSVLRSDQGPHAPAQGYGILEGYTGHGIGTEMHMEPAVHNFRVKGRGPKLRVGAVLAVEPMITLGDGSSETLGDHWTVVTADGTWSAHWEHTIAVTPDGPWVLTAHDGGVGKLAALGVQAGSRAAW